MAESPERIPKLAKCRDKVKDIEKAEDRLLEALKLYEAGHTGYAVSRMGAAMTSLALAKSKGLITSDEWRDLAGRISSLRKQMADRAAPPSEIEGEIRKLERDLLTKYLTEFERCLL